MRIEYFGGNIEADPNPFKILVDRKRINFNDVPSWSRLEDCTMGMPLSKPGIGFRF